MAEKTELGDRVKDKITGLKGIVIGRYEYLYGCVRMAVQPEEGKDGKPIDTFVVDEPQLMLLKKGVIARPLKPAEEKKEENRSHGLRDDPDVRSTPKR